MRLAHLKSVNAGKKQRNEGNREKNMRLFVRHAMSCECDSFMRGTKQNAVGWDKGTADSCDAILNHAALDFLLRGGPGGRMRSPS